MSVELTDQEKEYIKCARNPIYFLNNYGHVFNAKKQTITKMTCFEYQNKCLRRFHKYQNNIILKSRQTGLSVVTAGYIAWRLMFRNNEKILIIANDGAGARRFLKTVKQFLEYAPDWMKPDGEVVNNQTKIEYSNGSWAEAKASSPEAGRGESLTMLVLDETAFIKDAEPIWMAAGMALSQTGGKCIMISTPNGTGNLYHKTWTQAEKGKGDFVGTKVHWTENPFANENLEYRVNEEGDEYPWSPWYENQKERLHYDSVKIAQELDLSFEGSKRLAIPNELISRYEKKVNSEEPKIECYYDFDFMTKKGEFTNKKTSFYIFKKPKTDGKYILAADVARGDGTDYSTIQILDAETLEQVAEYQYKLAPDLFAYIIYAIAMEYNEAFVTVEANSFGLGTCFDLKNKMGYKRMFISKNVKDIHVRPKDFKVDEGVEIPGIQTTKKTRPLFIKALIEYMREGELVINSPRVISEMWTFINKNGKPEHEPGYNDDLIFALAIALYVRDTEYENIMLSKGMFKAMMDAMSYSSTSSGSVSKNEAEKKIDAPPGAGGIFFNREGLQGSDDNSEDDSWLFM
jgi:hypothetical protein